MKLPLKYMFILVTCLLAGCVVPIPHTTLRSSELQGRVLDARTREPIQGAKVFLTYQPSVSCRTDSSGHFRLKATYNFHLAYLPVGGETGDWPNPQTEHGITVSHTSYLPSEISSPFVPLEVLLKPRP
jgi:hypothetical protein